MGANSVLIPRFNCDRLNRYMDTSRTRKNIEFHKKKSKIGHKLRKLHPISITKLVCGENFWPCSDKLESWKNFHTFDGFMTCLSHF